MEKDLNEERARIENEIKKLPEKAQYAIRWVVKNFNLVAEMCRKWEMTDEELKQYENNARKKEDYVSLVLLCAAEIYKKSGFETMEQ